MTDITALVTNSDFKFLYILYVTGFFVEVTCNNLDFVCPFLIFVPIKPIFFLVLFGVPSFVTLFNFARGDQVPYRFILRFLIVLYTFKSKSFLFVVPCKLLRLVSSTTILEGFTPTFVHKV
jgi:hypothetical protein